MVDFIFQIKLMEALRASLHREEPQKDPWRAREAEFPFMRLLGISGVTHGRSRREYPVKQGPRNQFLPAILYMFTIVNVTVPDTSGMKTVVKNGCNTKDERRY